MIFNYQVGQIFYCKKTDRVFSVEYFSPWMNVLVFQTVEGYFQYIGAREMRYFEYIGEL